MKHRFFLIILLAMLVASLAFAGGKDCRFTTKDGVEIVGSLWMPDRDHAPGVILLHMLGRDRSTWDDFAEKLANQGYAVVSIDFRGHGESTKRGDSTLNYKEFSDDDFRKMTLDVQPVLDFFRDDRRIDSTRIVIIGASIGANVALQVAANDPAVRAVVLLSPGKTYHGVRTESAMLDYGKRAVLIAASEEDKYAAQSSRDLKELAQGTSRLLMMKNVGHGTNMLIQDPALEDEMINWLEVQLQ